MPALAVFATAVAAAVLPAGGGTGALHGAAPRLPDRDAMVTQIVARDAHLFDVFFNRCEAAQLKALVTDDIEFYHDRDGLTRGAKAFVADYVRFCTEAAKPGAWRSRREVVKGSLTVDPVPGVGAIETGEHVFYERKGNGPERLAGRAKFAHLWLLSPGGWRLSRAFSYSHSPAG